MIRAGAVVTYRDRLFPRDVALVRRLVAEAGCFRDDECDTAVELVEDCLARGVRSGYRFVFAEADGCTVGYACYGPIPCTIGRFDIYWLAVSPDCRRAGLGSRLLAQSEARSCEEGARRVYVETSSRPAYAGARGLYLDAGYAVVAILSDFYADGDAKLIYMKRLPQQR